MEKITDRLRSLLEQAEESDLLTVDVTETASGDVFRYQLSKGQVLACLRLACVARMDVAAE